MAVLKKKNNNFNITNPKKNEGKVIKFLKSISQKTSLLSIFLILFTGKTIFDEIGHTIKVILNKGKYLSPFYLLPPVPCCQWAN